MKLTMSLLMLPLTASQFSERQLRGADAGAAKASVPAEVSTSNHFVYTLGALSYCLAIDGDVIKSGMGIHLGRCDVSWQSIGQNFIYGDDSRIRMHQNPEYCVAAGDDLKNGGKLQLQLCDEWDHHQNWAFWHSGQIELRVVLSTPMCMAVGDNFTTFGVQVHLWTCSEDSTQDWLKLTRGPVGQKVYAVPNKGRACPRPFRPVAQDASTCVAAAEILRPGGFCFSERWPSLVTQVDQPSWPKGCYFSGGCNGPCGLSFNPVGHSDPSRSYPGAGECVSIDVICQLGLGWAP